jgi:hypothetical protein
MPRIQRARLLVSIRVIRAIRCFYVLIRSALASSHDSYLERVFSCYELATRMNAGPGRRPWAVGRRHTSNLKLHTSNFLMFPLLRPGIGDRIRSNSEVVGEHEPEGRKTRRHAAGDRCGALPRRTKAAVPPQRVQPMNAREFYAYRRKRPPPERRLPRNSRPRCEGRMEVRCGK